MEEVIVSLPWPSESSFQSVDFKCTCPKIDIVNINEYFLKVYNTPEGMSTFAAVHRKGYGMMKDLFLTALVYSLYNNHHCYRGQVNSEMTKNLTYFVKVIIHDNGEIVEGNCECVAGKGIKAVCKHIATVAYAILYFKEHRKWCIRTTCTSTRQVWHMPKKSKIDISPKKSEELCFSVHEYNVEKKAKSNMCYDPRPASFKNMPSFNDNVRNAVINYNSGRKRTLAISGSFPAASVAGVVHDHDYLNRSAESQLIYNKIIVSEKDLADLEVKTRSQSKSKLWLQQRKLRVTASIVGTIVHMTDKRNKEQFVDSIINPRYFKSVQTTWGKVNEKNAIAAYKKATTNHVFPCGLCVSREHPYLAASPDGLVGSETVLEAKCPYTIRNEAISDTKVDYLERINNKIVLKTSSNYYYQVQTQMYVTGRNFCDFVVWTKCDYLCISVDRNDEVINNIILPKVKNFYDSCMVPALFKKFYG